MSKQEAKVLWANDGAPSECVTRPRLAQIGEVWQDPSAFMMSPGKDSQKLNPLTKAVKMGALQRPVLLN